MTDTEPTSFQVNFATGQRFDLNAIRGRLSAFMPDNTHAWVISSVFAVEDPEQPEDDMELGPDNFVGVTPIRCLICSEPYASAKQFHKCPQRRPGVTP